MGPPLPVDPPRETQNVIGMREIDESVTDIAPVSKSIRKYKKSKQPRWVSLTKS